MSDENEVRVNNYNFNLDSIKYTKNRNLKDEVKRIHTKEFVYLVNQEWCEELFGSKAEITYGQTSKVSDAIKQIHYEMKSHMDSNRPNEYLYSIAKHFKVCNEARLHHMCTELIKVSVTYLKDNLRDIHETAVLQLYYEAAQCMMHNTSDQALMQCSKVHTFFENTWANRHIHNLNALFYLIECKCLNFRIDPKLFQKVDFINFEYKDIVTNIEVFMVYIMVLILNNDEKSLKIVLSDDDQVKYMLIKIEGLDKVIGYLLKNNYKEFVSSLSALMRSISFCRTLSRVYEKLFADIKSMLIRRVFQASTRVKFETLRQMLGVENAQIITEVNDYKDKYCLDLIEQEVFMETKKDLQLDEYVAVTRQIKRKLDNIEFNNLDTKIAKSLNSID